MQAKAGRPKQIKPVGNGRFVAPEQPANLTAKQVQVWNELLANPHLTEHDQSIVLDYMQLVTLRDAALDAILDQGINIDDAKGSLKTHPSYKVWRDATDRIGKMRDHLLMSPKSRLAVTSQHAPADLDSEDDLAALKG